MNGVKFIASIVMAAVLVACGGADNNPAPVAPSGSSQAPVSPTKVTLSGQVTYDHIPHKVTGFSLDYDAISKAPARGVRVVLLDAHNNAVAQSATDEQGQYEFQIDAGKSVKVQVRAQLEQAGQWDVSITDNTLGNAFYVLEGDLSSSGSQARQTRNLHAPSGWSGAAYTGERAAAPFAILGTIYEAIKIVQEVDPDAVFPEMEYRWSPDNKPVIGNLALGQIGTSGFHKDQNAVYLLGDADRDTDEYDPHVILHEWGHYFEHNLARMDSMGGPHSHSEKLDPRLAFSEGFGNGIAAIITGDPEYKDSLGAGQEGGFEIDFENYNSSRSGWYNEGSIAAILYDVFDADMDGNDRVSAGFGPIYKAMTNSQLRHADVFTTIFSFSHALLLQDQINRSDYALILDSQNISSSQAQGEGERNNGAITSSLPVYKTTNIDAAPITLCSVDDAGRFNKLGNREFVYFSIPATGHYDISLGLVSGDGQRDPDFNLWKSGEIIQEQASSQINQENFTGELTKGIYVAEVFDYYNINGVASRSGNACFAFSIRQG